MYSVRFSRQLLKGHITCVLEVTHFFSPERMIITLFKEYCLNNNTLNNVSKILFIKILILTIFIGQAIEPYVIAFMFSF